MLPTRTKKRASPETDASSDQSKRAKVEALQILDRTQEGGESEMHTIDSTHTPTSSCRSPSKRTAEIPSMPAVSSPDRRQMDVDVEDTSALLHFTSPSRSNFPFTTPPSPLTPLPSSPVTDRLPEMHTLLANTGVHVPSRPLSAAAASTPRPTSAIPGSPPASQSCPTRSPLNSVNSMESIAPPAAPQKKDDPESAAAAPGSSSQPKDASLGNPDVELSREPSSRSDALPISRPRIIEAMKPKRGPSVQHKPKRLTRSVSMKEQRVKGEDAEIVATTTEVPIATTNLNPVAGPSSAVVSKPRLPNSAGVMTPKLKPPPIPQRSATSVATLPPDSSKLRQASLSTFVKAQPSTTGGIITTGGPAASTSTDTGLSRVVPSSSPSKIPVPVSPLNRLSTSHSRGTVRRSLTTLSHALEKLAAPPPSRPNTSMGFLEKEGTSEDGSHDSKGKRKAKDDVSLPVASTAQRTRTSFAQHTASSLKRAAAVTGSGSAARMRGRGGAAVGVTGRTRGVGGIFGKPTATASKKTRLPVVMGSPVKGRGGMGDLYRDGDALNANKHPSTSGTRGAGGVTGEEDVFMSQDTTAGEGPQDAMMQDVLAAPSVNEGESTAAQKPSPTTTANASHGIEIDLTTSPILADKGKQRAVPSSTLNPASSALNALSESLSSLPQTPTPPKPRAVGTRTGLRSSNAAASKDTPVLNGSGGVGPSGNSEVNGSGPSSGTANDIKKPSLKILKGCAIFVDVRTEQGDNAGSLFVDMLKGLGAKIMSRLGSRSTHIVYKNGHPHTLTRYRMLNDPKPVVVGIAWVVECVEKRAKVPEEKFKIDVGLMNVAGGQHKRPRSMLPKHLIPVSPGPDDDVPLHVSSEADEDNEGATGIDGSPSQHLNLSIRSKDDDDLPPLERARRRRSVLPGGQTRLFS